MADVSVCLVCGEKMDIDLIVCEKCKTAHHKECWDYNGGCAVYGCKKQTLPAKIEDKGLIQSIIWWFIFWFYDPPEVQRRYKKLQIINPELHAACEKGDIKLMLRFTNLGADVNYSCAATSNGPIVSCVYQAIKSRNKEALRILIKQGANPNEISTHGYNPRRNTGIEVPLCTASIDADLDTVKLLVENGAEVNPPMSGFSRIVPPLAFALHNKKNDIAMFLMDNGADILADSFDNESMLRTAMKAGNEEMVKVILKKLETE